MSKAFFWVAIFSATLELGAQVPKTWDEAALADWATPIAALAARPGHFSAKEYYDSPVDNYRTYPVYAAGRGPSGYFEKLKASQPQPLIIPALIKTKSDWITAGKRVFEESDIGAFRRYEPEVIEEFRVATSPRISRIKPRADGTIPGARWVVTSRGLALTTESCTQCHRRDQPDGTLLDGPGLSDTRAFFTTGMITTVPGMSGIPLPGDSDSQGIWRSFAVPWLPGDIHEQLKTLDPATVGRIFLSSVAPNLTPRWSGSIYYPAKVPDLIALKGQKYIDHTGTHKLRGTADIMRYAALVTYADISDFGTHRMLTDLQRKVPYHMPDEALYALALYIESLQPPANPNPVGEQSAAGQKIFARDCSGCHTPPYYTSGKLTPAEGFTPTPALRKEYDILPISVKTDPSLALKTRKGTGFYKIPSLRGVWYRGSYLHDGAVTSLEEMFNPARLQPDFVPTGFKGVDKTRAVPGHEFGLRLSAVDRANLIAFLKTL